MKQQVTILVVEDNQDDFLLLEETLETSKEIEANVLHEERLEKAIEAAKNHTIDAAVIDLSLPDSFGLETFVSFYKHFPFIPAIIMTGAKDYDMALEAVQKGAQDYLFKGDPSPTAIVRTIRYAIERQRLTTELKLALERVKQLEGLLPICSSCKKIRDDKGYWNRIDSYLSAYTMIKFSHSICPDCVKILYPDLDLSND